MHEARRSQWPPPLASRATKQTARRAPSLRVAAKCGVCVVALLGFVGSTTTFVARLASIRILPATQSAEDLIRGSFSFAYRVAAAAVPAGCGQKARLLCCSAYSMSWHGAAPRVAHSSLFGQQRKS